VFVLSVYYSVMFSIHVKSVNVFRSGEGNDVCFI